MRLQKPEVKAPQSKVVSYGTSFLLVAKGPNVVSTYSENQKPFATLGSQKVAVDARSVLTQNLIWICALAISYWLSKKFSTSNGHAV